MTADELAVLLCRANHPHFDSVGRVPCADHIIEARRFHELTRPAKAVTLATLVKAAK